MTGGGRGRLFAAAGAGLAIALLVAALVVLKVSRGDDPVPAPVGAPGVAASDIESAIARLQSDIAAAPADQLDPAAGASLRKTADAAVAALAVPALCPARDALAPMAETLSRAVTDGTARVAAGSPIAAPTAARLDADDLDAQALILTSAGTESCGGAPPAGNAVPRSAGGGVEVADEKHVALHVAFPVPTFSAHEGDGHWYVAMTEAGTTTGAADATGKPGVPVTGETLAVPLGATPSASTSAVTSYDLVGVPLWPAQPSPIDGPKIGAPGTPAPATGTVVAPFTRDEAAYRATTPYPADVSGVGAMQSQRGLSLVTAWTSAGQYTASTQTLKVVTGADDAVTFGGANTGSFGTADLDSPWNVAFTTYWEGSVLNAGSIHGHLGPIDKEPGLCGEELMVVTNTLLAPVADNFAASRIAAGISTAVFTTDGPQGVGTTNVAIRDAIAHEVTNSACRIRPSYVVIVGDTGQVPTFHFDPGDFLEPDIASDLPFGFVHQWSQMHKLTKPGLTLGAADVYVAGDLTDLTPDVFVSRIPAAGVGEAFNMVNTITRFEDAPPLDAGYYTHVTGAEYFQACSELGCPGCPPNTKCDPSVPTAPVPSSQEVVPFLRPSEQAGLDAQVAGKTFTRVANDDSAAIVGQTVTPQQYYDGSSIPAGIDWTGSTAQIKKAVDGGTMLLWHADHGNVDGSGWYEPNFLTGDPAKLSPIAPPTIVWSSDCDSGKFDLPINDYNVADGRPDWYGHSWLGSGHGAAFVGSSRESYILESGWLLEGMGTTLFPELGNVWRAALGQKAVAPAPTMGALVAGAKASFRARIRNAGVAPGDIQTNSVLLEYNLFGDASMPVYRKLPRQFDPNDFQPHLASDAVVVEGQAHDGTWATVESGGLVLGRAFVQSGSTTIPVPADRLDSPDLVVVLDGVDDLHTTLVLHPDAVTTSTSTSTSTSSTSTSTSLAPGVTTTTTASSNTTAPPGDTTTSGVGATTTSIDARPTTTRPATATTPTPPTTLGPPPTVSDLSRHVVGLGPNHISVTGTNLSGATAVHIGSVAAAAFTVVSATQVDVDVPPLTAGITYDVTVTTPSGTSAISGPGQVPGDRYTVSS